MTADEKHDKLVEDNNRLDVDLFNDILVEVTSGGSLAAYCRDRGLRYKLVLGWINDDDGLQERYKLALDIRTAHAKDEVISEMFSLIRADVTDAFDEHGNMRAISNMPKELRRLIGGIKFREIFEMQPSSGGRRESVHVGTMHEIKFWDRPKAVETFMRHLKMLDTSSKVELGESLAQLLINDTSEKGETK